MKIRPKLNILKAASGVRFSTQNANGANWGKLIFNPYRLHILDTLAAYGEADDYGYWLNDMLSRHANLYNLAGGANGNWQNTAYENELVGQYQHDYKGDKRFGTFNPNSDYTYNFNTTGIANGANAGRYSMFGIRTSGDYGNHDWKVDNLYSAITDDRRLLGRKGDWDENSEDYKQWQKDLNDRGWEMYLDPSDNYYKLKRWSQANPAQPNPEQLNSIQVNSVQSSISARHYESNPKFDWNKLSQGLLRYMPELLEAGRLAGNLASNDRIYKAKLAGIRPNLLLPYLTHRQVLGDEGTKLAYYRRAAAGETRASRPITSDMDKLMAYMMEAKRIGDELRAQGDLADNAEIRRTSDESNQHQWANTLRKTEVANNNTIAINNANADRQQLLALKHAADWTSWNNYLLGQETRMKQNLAENKAIQDQIWALDQQHELSNNTSYQKAYDAYQDVVAKATKKYTDSNGLVDYSLLKLDADVKKAKQAFEELRYQLQRKQYQDILSRRSWYAKDGLKLTYKRKDDLLYKTARDAVEHFRKISKISSDATLKARTKPIKLSPHPGSKSRKMLQGGVAPFTVFTPAVLGGETSATTTSSAAKAASAETKKGNDTLDIIKDLFKNLEGLPSDVNGLYVSMLNFLAKQSLFGGELSSEDISTMYLLLLLQINRVKFSKKEFDDAKELATQKDALDEFAVDGAGRVAVLKGENISFANWEEVKKSKGELNPLTNKDLLSLRAYSPNMRFADGVLDIVKNGIGMTQIAKFIKENIPSIGSSDKTIEGYTKHESDQIKAGFELLKEAPAGDYKFSNYTKDLLKLAEMALKYIASVLPRNMKSVLKIHADINRTSVPEMLTAVINSQLSTSSKLEFDAVTGKASKDANGNSKSDEGLKLDAATALVSGKGYKTSMEFNTGTSYAVTVKGIHTEFLKKSGENMGQITMNEALQSSLKGVLDFDKASLGGSRINPMAYNHVVINNGDVIGVDLPVGNDKNTPDFTMLKKLQILDLELLKRGIQDDPENWLQVNQVCLSLGIPAKYDNQGNLNSLNWNRFAAFQVVTDDTALLNKNVLLGDMIKTADAPMRDLYEQFLLSKSDTKNYDLSDGFLGIGFLGRLELYLGTVFVPVKSNYVGAALSGGLNITMLQATDLELREQGYDKLKIGSYTKQYKLTDLND